MVIKAKSWKQPRFGALLRYMLSDKERIDAKFGFVLTHNVRGESIDQWEQKYKDNEEKRLRRRKDSVILNHFMLSFHREDRDHLDPDILQDITRKFIEEHNINGMYVAVPHLSQEHFHVHICASGIEFESGKSMRMSKASFSSLKTRVQEYQMEKYPELEKSVVDHGGVFKKTQRISKEDKREFLKSIYESIFSENENNLNQEQQLEALSEKGIEIYERGGKPYGMTYEGQNHRFSSLEIEHEVTHANSHHEISSAPPVEDEPASPQCVDTQSKYDQIQRIRSKQNERSR